LTLRKDRVVEHLAGLKKKERITTTKQADACGAATAHGSISSAHVSGMRPAPGPENVFIRAVLAVRQK